LQCFVFLLNVHIIFAFHIHNDVVFFTFQAGSRATLVLFDFVSKQLNIGCLGWVPLRILQAETKLDAIHLELDKEFLQTIGDVPGMEHYGSDAEDTSEKAESEQGLADEMLQLEANGMIVPVPDLDMALASLMDHEGLTGNDEEPDNDDVYTMGIVSLDDDTYDSVDIAVSMDEHGNLIACPEIELVINQDLMVKGPSEGGISVRGSQYLLFDFFREGHRRETSYQFLPTKLNIFYLISLERDIEGKSHISLF